MNQGNKKVPSNHPLRDSQDIQGCIQKIFPGGGKLGPHKRMTLAIMIIAYIYVKLKVWIWAIHGLSWTKYGSLL